MHYSFAVFNADAVDLVGDISVLLEPYDSNRGFTMTPVLLCGPRTPDIKESSVRLPHIPSQRHRPATVAREVQWDEDTGQVGYVVECQRIRAMSTWVILCETALAATDVRMRVFLNKREVSVVSGRDPGCFARRPGLPPLIVMLAVGLVPYAQRVTGETPIRLWDFDFVLIAVYLLVGYGVSRLIRERVPRAVMGYVGWDSPQYQDRRGDER